MFKVGDVIECDYDDEIVTGIIYEQGLKEDNEESKYWFFTFDNFQDGFDLNDPNEASRVRKKQKNIFE